MLLKFWNLVTDCINSHNGCELSKLNSKDMNLFCYLEIELPQNDNFCIRSCFIFWNKKYYEKKKLQKYLSYIINFGKSIGFVGFFPPWNPKIFFDGSDFGLGPEVGRWFWPFKGYPRKKYFNFKQYNFGFLILRFGFAD